MGFSLTSPAPEKCDPTAENRVWGFFGDAQEMHRGNHPQSLQPRQGNRPSLTRIVSGRTYWPSRDPIGERGGINLYGFVDNNPRMFIDNLGMQTMGVPSGEYNPLPYGPGKPNPTPAPARPKPPEDVDRPVPDNIDDWNCSRAAFRSDQNLGRLETERILKSKCDVVDCKTGKCETVGKCVFVMYWKYTLQKWVHREGVKGRELLEADTNFHIAGGKVGANGRPSNNCISTAPRQGFQPGSNGQTGFPSDFKPQMNGLLGSGEDDTGKYEIRFELKDFEEKCYCCPEDVN
jgi:hypothetical protein